MPPKPKSSGKPKTVATLRHDDAKRKNLPTAEYEPLMRSEEKSAIQVAYARRNRDLDPQLVWRGKDVLDWSDLVVPAPPLYIQEKVHPKVLIDDLLRQSKARASAAEPQIDLFADFNGLPSDARATEFYQHDANWTNRMILGDSLQVMASLAERESLRGKVQCIYFDPPYGIKFNSNFQWSTTSRDVTDGKADHITREPEQVKAFRDTWRDGIHSYLTYLRDRLTVARDLLANSGSIFVQIGDENLHFVRSLMDEVFGCDNFVSVITFSKTTAQASALLPNVSDYLVWYARSIKAAKFRQPYSQKIIGGQGAGEYVWVRLNDGQERPLTKEERSGESEAPAESRVFRQDSMVSQGAGASEDATLRLFDKLHHPGTNCHWKTHSAGVVRLAKADRVLSSGRVLKYKRFIDDFAIFPIVNNWRDTGTGGSSSDPRIYVVQTVAKAIERCILMATDPGDLVLDPTCGSGTTAYVAEQWGRRWITIDTSRVALALARARIMGARYPFYLLADSRDGQYKEAEIVKSLPSEQPTHGNIRHGFVYERVPHITLKSIANNAEIDVIWDKWQQTLEPLRARLNGVISDQWPVISKGKGTFKALEEWEIPRERPGHWPLITDSLITDYWAARIARQREIDASIAAKAEFERLYDKPYADNSKVRVAGPFTVESVSPHRTLTVNENDEVVDGWKLSEKQHTAALAGTPDFASVILENLKLAGVQQAHKEDRITFTSLTGWPGEYICAEGRYLEGKGEDAPQQRAAIFIGPEFGTVSRPDLVATAREAADAGFDILIACAFNYDAHSAEFEKLGRIPVLKARMNPDLHMAGELKNTGAGNLFVVFGEPDIELESGLWLVARGGRLVASYEHVKELSGLGGLEEINRLGRTSLSGLKELSARGTFRSHEPGSAGGGVGPVEHRGGSGAQLDRRVPAEPQRGQRLPGGGGDAVDARAAAGDVDAAATRGTAASSGRDQQDARRLEAVAAIQALTPGDFPLTTSHYAQVTVRGVDVFKPQTGEVVSAGPEGIACWFIDTDYNEESFFVRHAYFLGQNDPYSALKTTLKAEIDAEAWSSLHSAVSRPFPKPSSGRIAVKVINHLGDEVMKVFPIEAR